MNQHCVQGGEEEVAERLCMYVMKIANRQKTFDQDCRLKQGCNHSDLKNKLTYNITLLYLFVSSTLAVIAVGSVVKCSFV